MENQKMLSTREAVVGGMEGGPGPTGIPTTTASSVPSILWFSIACPPGPLL